MQTNFFQILVTLFPYNYYSPFHFSSLFRTRLDSGVGVCMEEEQKEEGTNNNTNSNNTASSPCYSRDSAIDSDLAEWDIETVDLLMVGDT